MLNSTSTATGEAKDCQTERLRLNLAYRLSLFGLVLVVALAWGLALKGRAASDVTAILGLVTGVLGTLVGAFFGAQIGADGKDKAEMRADLAQKHFETVMFALPDEAKKNLPDDFRRRYCKS